MFLDNDSEIHIIVNWIITGIFWIPAILAWIITYIYLPIKCKVTGKHISGFPGVAFFLFLIGGLFAPYKKLTLLCLLDIDIFYLIFILLREFFQNKKDKANGETKMYSFINDINEDAKILEEDIASIEEQFNIKFPDTLRAFYKEYNGAKIKLCVFTVDNYEQEINSLVPLKYGTLPFEKIVEWDRRDGFIPESFIPFASDRGGDNYYIDLENGKVFLSRSDDIENPYYVCDSIEELFKLMEACC